MLKLFKKPLCNDKPFPMSETLLDDLEIKEFLSRYFANPAGYITCDVEAINERNKICAALLANEHLAAAFSTLFTISKSFMEQRPAEENEPMQIVRNMNGIYMFRDAVLSVIHAISSDTTLPEVFYPWAHALNSALNNLYPANFVQLWEKYAGGVEKTASMSYYIHFTNDLTINAIALLNVNNRRYTKSTLINKFSNDSDPMRAESLLSLVPSSHSEVSVLFAPQKEATSLQRFSQSIQQMLMSQTAATKSQLSIMEKNITNAFRGLYEELGFIIGMVQYAQDTRIKSKHICFAEIKKKSERSLYAEKMVHPLLAEQADVVANDIVIKNGQEFILLGGINRGGKTTYLRTVGAIQVLFQMGLPIPAAKAVISPVTGMYSVFSRKESTALYQGKLGQELIEMRNVISALDEYGLFLGNEPISATSPAESYMLSRESLCMLKAKHVRGIWITHLYKLFDDVEGLNQLSFGSQFMCMHAKTTPNENAFLIHKGVPDKNSGASKLFYGYP